MNTGRVKIIYRHFPFLGPESWRVAEASECAAEQGGFHAYEETAYVNQGSLTDESLGIFAQMTGLDVDQFNSCLNSNKYAARVRHDHDAGKQLGVNSTPTIFIDGFKIRGVKPYGEYRVKIEQALAAAGQ